MSHRSLIALISAPLLLIGAATTSAQSTGRDSVRDFFQPRLYVGGGLGMVSDQTDYRIPANSNISTNSVTYGLNAYGGVKLAWFGIELQFMRTGEVGFDGVDANGVRSEKEAHSATSFNFVGFIPIGEKFEIIPRIGPNFTSGYSTGETCYVRTGRWGWLRETECRKSFWIYGIGARYALTDHWGARLDYTYYPIQDSRFEPRTELHHVAVNLEYRF